MAITTSRSGLSARSEDQIRRFAEAIHRPFSDAAQFARHRRLRPGQQHWSPPPRTSGPTGSVDRRPMKGPGQVRRLIQVIAGTVTKRRLTMPSPRAPPASGIGMSMHPSDREVRLRSRKSPSNSNTTGARPGEVSPRTSANNTQPKIERKGFSGMEVSTIARSGGYAVRRWRLRV